MEIKAEVVSADERESGLRRILNYGHTLGHALENLAGYGRYLHGEAVAWGMIAAARVAEELGMFPASGAERIAALLAKLSTAPVPENVDVKKLIDGTKRDKKAVAGKAHFVLPERIGSVVVRSDVDEVLAAGVVERCVQRG